MVIMKSNTIWDVKLRGLVQVYQHFRKKIFLRDSSTGTVTTTSNQCGQYDVYATSYHNLIKHNYGPYHADCHILIGWHNLWWRPVP
jgi:hypothetical protein